MRSWTSWIIPALFGAILIGLSIAVRVGNEPWDAFTHIRFFGFVCLCLLPLLRARTRRRGSWLFFGNFACLYALVAQAITPLCPTKEFALSSRDIHPGMSVQEAREIMRRRPLMQSWREPFRPPCTPTQGLGRDADGSLFAYKTDGVCGGDAVAEYRLRFIPGTGNWHQNARYCDVYVRNDRVFAVVTGQHQ